MADVRDPRASPGAGSVERPHRVLLVMVGFAALHALSMYAGRLTRLPPSELALAWPAAGVTFAWMLASRGRRQRLVAAAIITVVTGLINQATGVETLGSWLFGPVNASQGWVGAVVLERLVGWVRGRSVRSARVAGALGAACLAGSAVSAVAGGFVAWIRFDTGLWDGVWLIGFRNALSAFVVTAALLAVPRSAAAVRRNPRTVLLLVGSLLVTGALMDVSWPVAFALLLPLLLVAVRCGPEVTSLLVAVQGLIVVTATVREVGPFAEVVPVEARVLLAQSLILVLAIAGLVVSLAQRGREIALADSRRDRDRLHFLMEAALVASAHVRQDANDATRAVEVNTALRELTGLPESQLVGTDPATWLADDDAARLRRAVVDLRDGVTSGWHAQLRLAPSHGGRWVDAGLAFVDEWQGAQSDRGEMEGRWLMLQMVDITAQKLAEEELARIALHDELTGLPNRTLWADRLEQVLRQAERTAEKVALLYVDIDHFKQINDTYGHEVGDEILKQVAGRLVSIVRPHDTVARFGGDEFVVLCPELVDESDGLGLARRIQDVFRPPIEVEGRAIAVSTSVAFADDGDARSLLRHADTALYAAKDGGRSRFEIYHPDQHVDGERTARLLLDLERGYRAGELGLEYQPIVDVAAGRTVALEALLRWYHPEHGRLLPARFLNVLESSELIHPVGEWVLRQACTDAAELLARGARMTVHVNISARELSRSGLVDRVRSTLTDTALPAELLVLEITETRLFTVTGSLLRDLEALRDLGVRLAVDDFGTGFGTLSHLVDLPIDIAKLDRSFVTDIVDRPNARSVSNAVRSLAAGLGMESIAEGVESEAQAAMLIELGYCYLQGFLYGRPEPLETVSRRLLDPS